MTRRHDNFPDQPETLPLDIETTSASARFDPNQRRAFGSVPTLVGRDLEIPKFEHLDGHAWELTDASVILQGLYSDKARYAVNGLALSPELHGQIIRNQKAFKASIGAKTMAANRLTNPDLAGERFDKSQVHPLIAKQARHEAIIQGLEQQEAMLETLIGWQRQPGYSRTSESELRILATSAWSQTFDGILHTLRDNYGLSNDELVNMQHALAYRLFRGGQNDRTREWGEHLKIGSRYTRSVRLLFQQSERNIQRDLSA
ncbi:MAG TPA: hypothetical protein VGE34_03580 [Candidatus Saccharimonadales bacterium]